MRKKDYAKLSISLLLGAVSCQTAPPNIPVCVEISLDRGTCIETISGRKFDIDTVNKFDGDAWWDMRATMIMIPWKEYGKLKSYIIKQCKVTGKCDKEISSWDRTLETVDEIVRTK